MAHSTTTAQGSFQGVRDAGLLARSRKALADYRLYRKTLAELQMLTERELHDLGLSRFSIREVAYDAVYGG